MNRLEQLLLLWQDQTIANDQLDELKQLLAGSEARAKVAQEFFLTGVILESLRTQQAAQELVKRPEEPPAPEVAARLEANLRPGRRSRVLWLAAAAAAVLVALGAYLWFRTPSLSHPPTPVPDPAFAQFEQVHGDPFVVSREQRLPAQAGQVLVAGQGIATEGVDSEAVVQMKDAVRLKLGGDTTVLTGAEGDEPSAGGPRIVLEQGELLVEVNRSNCDRARAMNRKQSTLGVRVAILVLLAGLGALAARTGSAEEPAAEKKSAADAYPREVQPLLARYCVSCHGSDKPRGGLNLETLPARENLKVWKEVWHRVRSRQMPPPDRPQPTAEERARLTGWIEGSFARHTLDGQPDPGPLRPRRLNVRETMNTLRDLAVARNAAQPRRASYAARPDGSINLFQIYPPPEHPCAFVPRTLPQDTSDGGFDTIGENLSIPPTLLEKYLRCSKLLLDDLFSLKGKDSNGRYQWSLRELVEKAEKGPLPRGIATRREAVAAFLREFASRAFRRPATAAEVEKYVRLFDLAQQKGEDFETSIRLPLQAILVSPRFVVLWSDAPAVKPGKDAAVRPLDDHELAARLSYFLWSSLPDRDLSLLAEQGRLQDPQVLEQQVRRMLNDRRVTDGLLEGFLCQWLQLDRLERSQPDADRFAYYFQNNLGELMTRELVMFADAVTVEDRSILEFVDADWGFLCYPLAQHYGIDNFPGKKPPSNALPAWYRVKYPDRRRGGVLTMGKVLTGTSQPLRTSPVHRGKWILETILGTPPPPPPPNVDNDLKEDKADAKNLTVPQLLARHRDNPACASCHQMIDPLGMVFETYDPVGKWRDQDQGQPIDPRGTLTDGAKFNGVEELKTLLLAHKGDFVRGFVEQMLTYALGRKLEFYDAATVKQIVQAVAADDYKFARVVVEVAKSYPFRHRRTREVTE